MSGEKRMLFFVMLPDIVCPQATNRFLDSAFIATLLETASVVAIFMAWREMTESKSSSLLLVNAL